MKQLGYFLLGLPTLIILGILFYENYKIMLISLGVTALLGLYFTLCAYLINN